jgi:hypothetical protein
MNSDCRANLKSHVYWVSSRTVIWCRVSLVLYLLSGYSLWTHLLRFNPFNYQINANNYLHQNCYINMHIQWFKKNAYGVGVTYTSTRAHSHTHIYTATCQLLWKCKLLSFPLCSVASEVIRVCVQQIQWWWGHELNLTVCALQGRKFIIAKFWFVEIDFLLMVVVTATETRWNVVLLYKNFFKIVVCAQCWNNS